VGVGSGFFPSRRRGGGGEERKKEKRKSYLAVHERTLVYRPLRGERDDWKFAEMKMNRRRGGEKKKGLSTISLIHSPNPFCFSWQDP